MGLEGDLPNAIADQIRLAEQVERAVPLGDEDEAPCLDGIAGGVRLPAHGHERQLALEPSWRP